MKEEIVEDEEIINDNNDPRGVTIVLEDEVINNDNNRYDLDDLEILKLKQSGQLSGDEEVLTNIFTKTHRVYPKLIVLDCKCPCGCKMAVMKNFHNTDLCVLCQKDEHY